jgi:hypothetical protein
MSNEPSRPPLYARVLRLRHLRPGGILCSLFFEGAVAGGVLLALAELASWWSVAILPVTVAAMVKVNDVVAGALGRSAGQDPPPAAVAETGPPAAVMPRPAAPTTLRPVVARAAVPGVRYARPPAQRLVTRRSAEPARLDRVDRQGAD